MGCFSRRASLSQMLSLTAAWFDSCRIIDRSNFPSTRSIRTAATSRAKCARLSICSLTGLRNTTNGWLESALGFDDQIAVRVEPEFLTVPAVTCLPHQHGHQGRRIEHDHRRVPRPSAIANALLRPHYKCTYPQQIGLPKSIVRRHNYQITR